MHGRLGTGSPFQIRCALVQQAPLQHTLLFPNRRPLALPLRPRPEDDMIGYFRLIEILDGPDVCMLRCDCLIAIDQKGKTRCESLLELVMVVCVK